MEGLFKQSRVLVLCSPKAVLLCIDHVVICPGFDHEVAVVAYMQQYESADSFSQVHHDSILLKNKRTILEDNPFSCNAGPIAGTSQLILHKDKALVGGIHKQPGYPRTQKFNLSLA